MIKSKKSIKSISLILCFAILVEAFLIPALSGPNLYAAEEGEFVASEALSPGEYLKEITGLMGRNLNEIESHSYAQWMVMLTNTLIMLDPHGTDVMTFQYSITRVLNDIEKIRKYAAEIPKKIQLIEKISGFGFSFFSRFGSGSNVTKFQNMFQKIHNSMEMLGNKQSIQNLKQATTYMKSPYSRGNGAVKTWYKKGPMVDTTKQLSSLQTGAMKVGCVLQIIAGAMELYRSIDVIRNDPGAPSFASIQVAINGAILVATALMAFPPPGAWTVAAFVIIGAWELIKNTFNKIGEKIAKWHKSYEDSLKFMRETDERFRAFYDQNIFAKSSDPTDGNSPLIDPLERSSSLVFADELRESLEKEPGEGEIAERQQELIKNVRAQGILTTYYYQQAEAARKLPANIEDLYVVWNHRADYMAWKPEKPRWSWNPIKAIGSVVSWAGNTVMEEILGTHDQLEKDKEQFSQMCLFCPDFALMTLFRRYVTGQVTGSTDGKISEVLGFAGVRIEQSPFNYMPLIEIYANDLNNWNDDILGQSFAADSLLVASKEMPYMTEQLKFGKEQNENTTLLTLAKLAGFEMGEDNDLSGFRKAMLWKNSGETILKQLEGSVRMRVQLDELLKDYGKNPGARLENRKVNYSFNGKDHNFKLVDELFKGKKIINGGYNFDMKLLSLPLRTALLQDVDAPEDENKNPEFIFSQFGEQIARNLQLNLNSLGISGVDIVRLGIQLKSELDVLELAKNSLKAKKDAFEQRDSVIINDSIRKLVNKGEYIDVTRSGLSNFFSSYDPPKDMIKHNIEKLEDAVSDLEKSIEERKEIIEKFQGLYQQEYENWLRTFKRYEDAAGDIGIELTISSSDPDYSAANLKFIVPFTPLDPAAAPE